MKFDMTFFPSNNIHTDMEQIKQAEALGFDGAWSAEVAHNPFFPLTLGAKETDKIQLGTQIAVAFPRSPMVTAQIAWDLAQQSNGRFILGLGTQVRAHITRRFSEEWANPVSRMREYIEGMRAIWDTFQNDARLRYRGEHYTFRLMAPFFNPGPIEHPHIPIYVAGVNAKICRLAGELCDGLHAHGFHTVSYLNEVVMANVEQGLAESGRNRADFALTIPLFVVTGKTPEETQKAEIEAKSRIAFYGSTPSYKAVMEHHGWDALRVKLSQMARAGQWDTMWQEVPDDMLHEMAIIVEPDHLIEAIQNRYAGLGDRICLEWKMDKLELMQTIAEQIRS
jgi:probable F420-dependent oxidoreductase